MRGHKHAIASQALDWTRYVIDSHDGESGQQLVLRRSHAMGQIIAISMLELLKARTGREVLSLEHPRLAPCMIASG